jgi:glucosamine-6-phosphate deaminase
MKQYFFEDYARMSERAAMVVAAAILEKEDAVLGLATGATPIGLYDKLSEWCAQGIVDFSRVRIVNLDEYCGLAPDDPNSYRYFMNTHLFNRVNIPVGNTHVPNGMAKDLDAECTRYDRLVEELGGIDLQLLGIGHDGHIGFNEPGDTFEKGTNVVTLTPETIRANARFFRDESEVPRRAITMGIKSIMKAKKILLIVSGEDKRDILEKAINGSVTPKVPASILQMHPDVTVMYSTDPGGV